jgi:hypothetical protein
LGLRIGSDQANLRDDDVVDAHFNYYWGTSSTSSLPAAGAVASHRRRPSYSRGSNTRVSQEVCLSKIWDGMESYQKAIQELEHDARFLQKRMNGFKAARKMTTGDQWLRKFKVDLVGETVIARRGYSGFSDEK